MSDRLPVDIQRLVLDKVSSPRDHARFSCACKLWYSIYKERTFPWFVLGDHDNENHTRGFFSVYDQKIYRFSALELEEKELRGSSHGWLVTIDNELAFGLYNPFSKTFIQLPPSPFDEKGCVIDRTHKVILSCNPCTNPNECTIMLLHHEENLAYCKLGDKSWTPISSEIEGSFYDFEDVMFYKGNFAVVSHHQVFICHIGPEPHFTPFGPKISANMSQIYLVNLEGDVVIVDRYMQDLIESEDIEDDYLIQDEQSNTDEDSNEDEDFVGSHFDVYKLDKDMTRWKKENEIGDQILFLGFNESISLSTSLVPNSIANTIYYAEKTYAIEPRDEEEDIGIFHLEKWRSILLYPTDVFDNLMSSPPVWLIQN